MLFAEYRVSPLPLAVVYTFVLNGMCQNRFDLVHHYVARRFLEWLYFRAFLPSLLAT
jgi:hypothetical protein